MVLEKKDKISDKKARQAGLKPYNVLPTKNKKPALLLGMQVVLASFNEAQPPTGGFV